MRPILWYFYFNIVIIFVNIISHISLIYLKINSPKINLTFLYNVTFLFSHILFNWYLFSIKYIFKWFIYFIYIIVVNYFIRLVEIFLNKNANKVHLKNSQHSEFFYIFQKYEYLWPYNFTNITIKIS